MFGPLSVLAVTGSMIIPMRFPVPVVFFITVSIAMWPPATMPSIMAISTMMIFEVSIMPPISGILITVMAKTMPMVAAMAVGIAHRDRWLMIRVMVMNQRADCDSCTDTNGHPFPAMLLFGVCPCG